MTTISSNHGERLACLEGAYEHFATKTDIANMELRLNWRIIIISIVVLGIGIGTLIGALKYLP